MSFLSKIGQDLEKDRKLVILRKRYFHDILKFNQNQQQKKKQDDIKEKNQLNKKILKMNQQELQILQNQRIQKLQEKILNQHQLKYEYERQIKQKRQLRIHEKQIDKQFVKIQEKESEKASQRRLQDLMKIYERIKSDGAHRRIKTEILKEMSNPQAKQPIKNSNIYKSPSNFLPPLEKISQSPQAKLQNQLKSTRSGRSVGLFSKRTLY